MCDDIDIHLGRSVRRRRRSLGLTQQQVADACGTRFQQIQKYECAARRMSAVRLWQMSRILGVPIDHFYQDFAGMPGDKQLTGPAWGRPSGAGAEGPMRVPFI